MTMSVPVCAELEIPLAHIRLAARTWGKPGDPPLLALHGWLDNAGSFDALAPLLDGRHVVALDLAGHGRSAHREASSWYPYVDYLDEIAGVIDFLGWDAPDLLGHSLGATLASVFAAVFPQRVNRLALIEGLGPLSLPEAGALEQLQRAMSARVGYRGGRLRVFPHMDAAIAARQQHGQLTLAAARSIVIRGTKSAADPQAPEACVWSSDPRLMLPSPIRLGEAQVLSILAGITAPTLLVLAQPEQSYLPRAKMDARIATVADIRVVRMCGSHHLHLEKAGEVAAEIRHFLGLRAGADVSPASPEPGAPTRP